MSNQYNNEELDIDDEAWNPKHAHVQHGNTHDMQYVLDLQN